MKRIIIPIVLLSLVALSAFAQHGAPPPMGAGIPGIGPGGNDALAEYLNLTADQKTAWQTIQSDLRTAVQALHEQERTLAEQLRTALEGSDAAAIGNLMLQIRAIGTQIEAARDAADAKFAATLTAEQKVKFEAFQAAMEFLRQRGPGGPPR